MKTLLEEVRKQNTDHPAKRRILFVCTGNTCRSPMAEAVANAMEQARAQRDHTDTKLEAFSAGIAVRSGDKISENAVLALEHAGVEAIAGHDYHKRKVVGVHPETAETYDLIVGMTQNHAMELLFRFPHLASKIVTMPKSIHDPYGQDLHTYETCLDEITQNVKELLFSEQCRD